MLDVYFRQCAILVTARDLAVMAATLANRGVNPVTGMKVASPHAVGRTISIMMTSGMYDYAGEWTYRVGIPAKSGVGGGIAAVLPAQLGVGTFSPLLDSHGNSVRGMKVCEALSSRFDLHMLNRGGDVRSCLIADYEAARVSSRRNCPAHERKILDERRSDIRVLDARRADLRRGRLRRPPPPRAATERRAVDPRPAPRAADHRSGPAPAGGLFHPTRRGGGDRDRRRPGAGRAAVAGAARWRATGAAAPLRPARRGDQSAENQLAFRYGGFTAAASAELAAQPLLAGLSAAEIAALEKFSAVLRYEAGEKIIVAGDKAELPFFQQSGMVSVKLPSGVRLATFGPGDGFGEIGDDREPFSRRRGSPTSPSSVSNCRWRRWASLGAGPQPQAVAQPFVAAGAAPDSRQRQS